MPVLLNIKHETAAQMIAEDRETMRLLSQKFRRLPIDVYYATLGNRT